MSDRVQSVERALSLLEEVAASDVPLTAPEIARRAGLNRATTWRLLSTLEYFDLLGRDPRSGRYSVSYGAVRLARATDASSLVRRAHPTLEWLAAETDGNAFLEISSRGRLIVLDEARPATLVQVDVAGMEIPLHCGSLGKLYLASLPEPDLARHLEAPLRAETTYTVTDPATLRAQIEECRRTGVAINYMEHREEWCGISSAIRDRAGRDLGYLNVTLPTYRWSKSALEDLGSTMRQAAEQVENQIYQRTEPEKTSAQASTS